MAIYKELLLLHKLQNSFFMCQSFFLLFDQKTQ